MQYQAYFERRHLTEMRDVRCGTSTIEISRSEEKVVVLSVDYDPLARHAEFIDTATRAFGTEYPANEVWATARFKGARECRSAPQLPTMLTSKDSPAYLLALVQAQKYPTLYGNDEYTAYRVWNHWLSAGSSEVSWSKSGMLIDRNDIGTERDSVQAQVAAAQAYLAQGLTAEEQTARDTEVAYRRSVKRVEAFPEFEVLMYPASRHHAPLCSLPDNVETSFLTAATDLCRYFLLLPVWQCCACSPAMREDVGQAVYERDLYWRSLTLADGATYRAVIDDAYADIIAYRFRARALAAGFKDECFPFDASLPPQWIPPLKESAAVLEAQAKLANRIITKIVAQAKAKLT